MSTLHLISLTKCNELTLIIAASDACSEYSTELNAARIKVHQAQEDIVTEMKESASVGLLRVTKDANAYKKVLKGLIVQVNGLTGCKFLSLSSLRSHRYII